MWLFGEAPRAQRPGMGHARSHAGPSWVPPASSQQMCGTRAQGQEHGQNGGPGSVPPKQGSVGGPDRLLPIIRGGGLGRSAGLSQLLTHMVTMTTKAKRQGPIMFQAPLRSSCRDMAKISVPRRNRTWTRHRGDHRVTGTLSQSFMTTQGPGGTGALGLVIVPQPPLSLGLRAASRFCPALH